MLWSLIKGYYLDHVKGEKSQLFFLINPVTAPGIPRQNIVPGTHIPGIKPSIFTIMTQEQFSDRGNHYAWIIGIVILTAMLLVALFYF